MDCVITVTPPASYRKESKLILTKEHYQLLEYFEKSFKGVRIDREPKDLWTTGQIYEDGETNKLFSAFRLGYSFGKAVERSGL